MIIPISKKYRLTSNTQCWQVEQCMGKWETGERAGEEQWRPIYYLVEFENAVKAVHELRIRRIPHETFDLIGDSIKRIEEETIKALEQVAK